MRPLRILDLCAGTGSATQAFRDAGHQVIRLEIDPAFGAELTMDVREFAKDPQRYLNEVALARGWIQPGEDWLVDVVWASPPCTCFSMAGSGKGKVRWLHIDRTPEFLAYVAQLRKEGKTPGQARAIAERDHFDPLYGPRLPLMPEARLGVAIILACRTAIRKLRPRYWWLENPQGGLQTLAFMLDEPGGATVTYCQFGDSRMKPTVLWGVWPSTWKPRPKCKNRAGCHAAAPRGSRTPGSTQGHKDAKTRAMVPLELSREIERACMEAL